MLRNSRKKRFFAFFSKIQDGRHVWFLDVSIVAPSRFRRYNILFALSCLWMALEPVTSKQTHRIAYYSLARAVARARENSKQVSETGSKKEQKGMLIWPLYFQIFIVISSNSGLLNFILPYMGLLLYFHITIPATNVWGFRQDRTVNIIVNLFRIAKLLYWKNKIIKSQEYIFLWIWSR